MTKLALLINRLETRGCRLVLDRKRASGEWKAQAWKQDALSGWYKVRCKDGMGDTPEAAIEALLEAL